MESNYLTLPKNATYSFKGMDYSPNFDNLFLNKYKNMNIIININKGYASFKKNSGNYCLEDILNHMSQLINTIIDYDANGARGEYAKENKDFNGIIENPDYAEYVLTKKKGRCEDAGAAYRAILKQIMPNTFAIKPLCQTLTNGLGHDLTYIYSKIDNKYIIVDSKRNTGHKGGVLKENEQPFTPIYEVIKIRRDD
jgi:hypothetical protein